MNNVNCLTCKLEFVKNGNNQKYCSKKCQIKKWNEDYKIIRKESNKKWQRKIKLTIIHHYSNGTMQCNCCGENHIEFLTIDHINCGNRLFTENKRPNKYTSGKLYSYLINNNFPLGYQILCFNCNCAKGAYGKCPHKNEEVIK